MKGYLSAVGVLFLCVGCQQAEPDAAAPVEPPEPAAQQAAAPAESPAPEAPAAETPAAQTPATPPPAEDAAAGAATSANTAAEFTRLSPPDADRFPNLKQMSPQYDVWFDQEQQRVILRGGVCLREGPLELFACIHQWVEDEYAPGGKLRRGTKEYESIVTINTTAALVHTALLAAGADVGGPARFTPEYQPAKGTQIDVALHWHDAQGEHQQAPAQHWLRHVETGEASPYPWVFAGSGFWTDEATGRKDYLAENGNLICVSNFPDAMLDLPVPSSQENNSLLFEAFTERIPPMGTPVTIVLTPQKDEAAP